MNAAVPAIPEPSPTLSQPARIASVFYAPTKAFSGLERNAGWWMAWLLLSMVALGFVYTLEKKVGFDQIVQNEMEKNPRAAERLEKLTPEQRQKQLAVGVKIGQVMAYATPVLTLLTALIVAGVFTGTFNFVLSAKIPFRVALAVVIYGFLPGVIHGCLGILAFLVAPDPATLDVQNSIASNPGYFIDAQGHRALQILASSLDVFALWSAILMGIGFACQSKVKRGTAISVVVGWYFGWTLLKAGWAAIFS
jgi:hypothetical protein